MISVSEALEQIEKLCDSGDTRMVSLNKALGQILAEEVRSPISMPPFRQSSMDGYAIRHSDHKNYQLVGEVKAGDSGEIHLKDGEAVRIFTGARVPDSADTIVVQENATREGDGVQFSAMPKVGANIRPAGEQIVKNDVAVEKGTFLSEAVLSFLAGLGITRVPVYTWPKVTIIITGNELKDAGTPLKPGEIYESNSLLLELSLKKLGIKHATTTRVKDDLEDTISVIKKALKSSDVVLISGGISVGDYDFVKEALSYNEVEELFYKVNQKPGKPLWLGKQGSKVVFALPGNPASSLSCFYVYVLPLLKAKLGHSDYHLPRVKAILSEDVSNPQGKTLFLKGRVLNDRVEVLTGQASSMLKSFAVANALIIIPEDKKEIKAGEEVSCVLI